MRFTNTASLVTLLASFAILAVMPLPAAQQAGSNQSVTQKSAATQPSKAGTTAGAAAPKSATKTTASAAKTTTAAPKTAAKKPAGARYSPWKEPTYADSTIGDRLDGEDLTVRRAAVDALGRYNGSVVVADPNTGRVLSMVNQKVALTGAFQPCSTIKLSVAMAALVEGIIDRNTILRIAGKRLSLTDALAHSNNPFFASLGEKLGFARFSFYARLFGLGELAGLNIEGEQPGVFPSAPTSSGVGMMTSFGDGIALTPLQLASLLSALANGGTLYYLQYPQTNEEVRDFAPKVRRRLDIAPWLSDIKPGMMAAVEYGTARRANYDPNEPVFGKTGTCTDNRTHLGWFGSFNDVGRHRLVVVVLLTGGSGVGGSVAAEVAGNTYKRLSQAEFFNASGQYSPAAPIATRSCCGQ